MCVLFVCVYTRCVRERAHFVPDIKSHLLHTPHTHIEPHNTNAHACATCAAMCIVRLCVWGGFYARLAALGLIRYVVCVCADGGLLCIALHVVWCMCVHISATVYFLCASTLYNDDVRELLTYLARRSALHTQPCALFEPC